MNGYQSVKRVFRYFGFSVSLRLIKLEISNDKNAFKSHPGYVGCVDSCH